MYRTDISMPDVYCLFGMELTSELKLSYLYKKWNNSAFAEYIYLNLYIHGFFFILEKLKNIEKF